MEPPPLSPSNVKHTLHITFFHLDSIEPLPAHGHHGAGVHVLHQPGVERPGGKEQKKSSQPIGRYSYPVHDEHFFRREAKTSSKYVDIDYLVSPSVRRCNRLNFDRKFSFVSRRDIYSGNGIFFDLIERQGRI